MMLIVLTVLLACAFALVWGDNAEALSLLQTRAAIVTARSTRQPKPHLVFILIDDMGFNDFVKSPDLGASFRYTKSRLNGAILVNSTYTQPLCAPSRSTFMTGRYWSLLKYGDGWGSFDPAGETTLAQKLNHAGYKSYAVGKWHLGFAANHYLPGGRGFSRFYGNLINGDHFTHCTKEALKQPAFDLMYEEIDGFENPAGDSSVSKPYIYHGTDNANTWKETVYNEKVTSFMLDHKKAYPDKPFFLYFAPASVHGPFFAKQPHNDRCGHVVGESRKTLCAMNVGIDDTIEKIEQVFQGKLFAQDDYVVVVTGDNGGTTWYAMGSNSPLRGQKGEQWEGGVRQNALVFGRHPDLTAKRTSMLGQTYTGGFMHLVDWHATLSELGGALPLTREPPNDISGDSVWSALLDNSASPRTELYGHEAGSTGWSYIKGDMKLIVDAPTLKVDDHLGGHLWRLPAVENYSEYLAEEERNHLKVHLQGNKFLFNLTADPSESNPITNRQDIVSELTALKKSFGGRITYGRDSEKCCKAAAAEVLTDGGCTSRLLGPSREPCQCSAI